MDNLTHGLLGLAIGALRRPDGARRPQTPGLGPRLQAPGLRWTSPTDRAVLLGCAIAAELPDLDDLLPAADPVLHALATHRGISHALVRSPVWAAVATLLARLVFRRARPLPVLFFSWAAVVFAHLAADLWTGWGTRIFLPFSDRRFSLDYVAVIDPFFTLPLLAGAIAAGLRRWSWRRFLLAGLVVSTAYLGVRIGSRHLLVHRVEAAYPAATRVEVFPALLEATSWRYAAELPDGYEVGRISLDGPPVPAKRHPLPPPLPRHLAENPTVAEALVWARLPLVRTRAEGEAIEVRVADLRYHIDGDPTLEFVVLVDPEGRTLDARLERGGNVRQVWERWRNERRTWDEGEVPVR